MQELYLAFNQLSGEVPDLSNAHNLMGFAIPQNNYSGELVIDSSEAAEIFTECLTVETKEQDQPWHIDFEPTLYTGFGGNKNCLTDIRMLDSTLGPLHFGTENGYVDISMANWEGEDRHFLFAAAYPMYEGYEFVGWFDADGNLVSTEQKLRLFEEGYVDTFIPLLCSDITAVFAEPVPAPLSGVYVEPYVFISVGESYALHARPIPLGAVDYEFGWAIESGDDVITLDAEGDTATITAVANGEATVKLIGIYHGVNEGGEAQDQFFYAYCGITVQDADLPIPLLAVELNYSDITIDVDETIDFRGSLFPADADIEGEHWVISNYGDPRIINYAQDYVDFKHLVVTGNKPGIAVVEYQAIYYDYETDTDIMLRARCTIIVSDGNYYPPGDVDQNGEVTITDAVLALRRAMLINDLTYLQMYYADMDKDGSVTIIDALLILRRAMGII